MNEHSQTAEDEIWWKKSAGPSEAADHGLTPEEYSGLKNSLGRDLNLLELGVCSALFSEHCSYKSSKVHLRTLPTEGEAVIQGPGENAGIIDIGDGLAAAFKVESHNHPSFIEPFQGAATGVGGILRDVFTMGARPLAVMNSLRFGRTSLPKTSYLLRNAVHGIGSYGNCVGVPTLGGELFFHEAYDGNCLVNAFALGVVRQDSIFYGKAAGVGNPIYYVGSKTGRDGIHGATMASEEFGEGTSEKRPTVQVGDPFQEKLLIEACLEVMALGCVAGIQDMGAAGLTSSAYEMAERAGRGVTIHLDRVPQRETGMNPYEIMLSESQERMLIVAEQGKEEEIERVFKAWELDAVQIGEVTDQDDVELYWNGELVSSMNAQTIASCVPEYRWPTEEPSWFQERQSYSFRNLPDIERGDEALRTLLRSPNLCSRTAVFDQYDSTVRSNTLIAPGGDAGVLRIKRAEFGAAGEGPELALAVSLDCRSRYCSLNPRLGAIHSVVKGYRNLVSTGAKPLALSDCLNFGNPEKPEAMWTIAEAVAGIGEAARALGMPVVSGNVSLYNETHGKGILPTPTIASVGQLQDAGLAVPSFFQSPGDSILLIDGGGEPVLGGTEFLAAIHGEETGALPDVDLKAEVRAGEFLRRLIEKKLLQSCHDVGAGGLAVALSESCFAPLDTFGAELAVERAAARLDASLFGEGGIRYLVSCRASDTDRVKGLAAEISDITISAEGKVSEGGEVSISLKDGKEVVRVLSDELRTLYTEGLDNLIR